MQAKATRRLLRRQARTFTSVVKALHYAGDGSSSINRFMAGESTLLFL
jgi:hypothetical protein